MSRVQLLNWINEVTGANCTKVENLGKGDVYLKLFSVYYPEVPSAKAINDPNQEYQFRQNWKLLQVIFDKYQIPVAIPVERLVKCKFQDNVEFCQLVKKHLEGENQNPVRAIRGSGHSSMSSGKKTPQKSRSGSSFATDARQLKENLAALEQERDFYFTKLRDIELVCQSVEKTELIDKILTIMYKTQEGFEIPNEAETF